MADDDDYADALEIDGRDLVAAAHAGELGVVEAREAEVDAVLAALDAGRSVLLTGASGVGKTAIVHAVAQRMAERDAGALVELSTTAMLSRTRYIGEWESKTTAIARAAEEEGAILYLTDIWNLPHAGRTSNSRRNMLDALRPFIERGAITLLAEAEPERQRQMDKVPGFTALFQVVPVPGLPAAAVDGVLDRAAARMGLDLQPAARGALVELTSTYLAARPQPGPALTLMEQVRKYREEKLAVGEAVTLDAPFIEKVFSIYSGLPLFVVSRAVTRPAADIRGWFQERIVGQAEAVEAVVETIALFKAGLHDPTRPLGTFLFVGPTGVGKTELARALASYLFGSQHRLLRFDLSEFKDYHAFELLLGDPHRPDQPARLIDPVRAQPFQVVLFDELEKAHPNVYDLLLPLLDEGRLTPPGGGTVDFRNTILIATSNVGAQGADRTLGFGAGPDEGTRRARIIEALEGTFRPEFLNRFQHIAVFHPLDRAQVREVARQELNRILQREGIARRNLVVEVDDAVLDHVIARSYDPRYGARALKRELQRQVVLPLAMTLMERQVEPGAILKVVEQHDRLRVRVIETDESREHRAERAPVEPEKGRKLTRGELATAAEALAPRVASLASALDEGLLRSEQRRLTELRNHPRFWSDPAAAARDVRALERVTRALDRLDRLRDRLDELAGLIGRADARRALADAAQRLVQLEEAIVRTRRELVCLGPDGEWDALVEVRALAPGARAARDLVVRTYLDWARHHHAAVVWLFEPRGDDEPALVAIKGAYPYGFLRRESGLHRVRRGDDRRAVRVQVAPWTDAAGEVRFGEHLALKAEGQFGHRIRSRLAVEGGLVLQNERTLADNRELAAEVAPSWAAAPPPVDEVVRRYDLEPFKLRDLATGFTSGRADALSGPAFHELLCRRVDAAEN